ncbi:ketol-acid reductoisomerase [Pseudomonadota bacterium]
MKARYLVSALVILCLQGCAVSPSFPDKALIEPKIVTASITLEKQINERDGLAIPAGEDWLKIVEGTIPVVITAPHATRPMREGKRRFSDGGGTAALAVAVGELTGATVMYTTYEGPSDPNYYDDNAFKHRLKELIDSTQPKIVLDIHGSHPYRSYDVDLGTMNGDSLLGNEALAHDLIKHLRAEGLVSISYNRFSASKNRTITKFASNHGVPTIQLEFNSTWVTPSQGSIEAQRFSKLLQALVRFVNEASNELGVASN